jgi:hypothetical protein
MHCVLQSCRRHGDWRVAEYSQRRPQAKGKDREAMFGVGVKLFSLKKSSMHEVLYKVHP